MSAIAAAISFFLCESEPGLGPTPGADSRMLLNQF